MSSEIRINSELLISLVKERPVVWDKTIDKYKDKRLTSEAWKQVCRRIKVDFDLLESKERQEFEKLVTKKWANIRDNFMKCHKKLIEEKQSGASKKKRKYLFYEELRFLHKIANHRDTSSHISINTDQDDSESAHAPAIAPTEAERFQPNSHEPNNRNMVLDQNQSRMMCFFRSIAPTVEKLNDEEIVTFQYEVMKLLKDITCKKQSTVYETQQSEYSLEQLSEDHYDFKLEPGSSSDSNELT